MLPGTIVGCIPHDLAVIPFNWIGEVVDSGAPFAGAIVGHDGTELGFWVLPSVFVSLSRTSIETVVLASVVVSLSSCRSGSC